MTSGETIQRRAGVFARYFGLGIGSFGLGFFLIVLLHEIIGIEEKRSVLVALAIIFFMNFYLARSFVFESRGRIETQLLKFAIISGVMRLVEYSIFVILFSFFGLYYMLAYVVSVGVSFFVKFFIYRNVVFRSHK